MSMSRFQEYMARRRGPESPLDTPRTVTFFEDRFAATKREETVSLRALVERIRDTRAFNKAMLPWLKLARFGTNRNGKTSLRNDPNVLEITGIEADYDGGQITIARAEQVLRQAGIAAMLYTSPSHSPEAPRWRVLCPTSAPMAPDTRAGLVARVNGLFVGALAGESFTLSQSYYFGAVEGMDACHEVVMVEGQAIDLADDLDDQAIGRAAKPAPSPTSPPASPAPRTAPIQDGASVLGREALAQRCDDIRNAWDGAKHQAINTAAFAVGGLVSAGHIEEATAWAELRAALAHILPRCKDKGAAERTLRRAFQEGIGRPQHVEPPPPPIPEGPHPAAAFLAKLAARDAPRAATPPQPQPVAAEIMQPGGVIQMLVEETVRSAMRPQPFLALGAAICAVGVLAGRKYRTKTDLRTNVYIAAVGESGSGKDHAPEVIQRCFDVAKLDRYLGGGTVASGRGMISAVEQHPARLFQIDELGMFLRTVTKDNAPGHKAEIWSELMKFYSRAKGVYRGTEYANKKEAPRVDINQPCVCFYGMTTPSTFWAALEGGAMLDGSLARFLVFVTDNHRPPRNRAAGIFTPSADLIAALQAIARGQGDAPKPGNLPDVHVVPMTATDEPDPYTVPMTPGAEALHEQKQEWEDAWANKVIGTPQAAIVNRLGENAAKLALICAISRNPHHPEITEQDIAWAWALAEHCTKALIKDASRFIADNEYGRKVNRLIEIVTKHGPITDAMICNRHSFRVPPKERAEILRDLVNVGILIAIQPDPNKPGPKTPRFAIAAQDAADAPISES